MVGAALHHNATLAQMLVLVGPLIVQIGLISISIVQSQVVLLILIVYLAQTNQFAGGVHSIKLAWLVLMEEIMEVVWDLIGYGSRLFVALRIRIATALIRIVLHVLLICIVDGVVVTTVAELDLLIAHHQ